MINEESEEERFKLTCRFFMQARILENLARMKSAPVSRNLFVFGLLVDCVKPATLEGQGCIFGIFVIDYL